MKTSDFDKKLSILAWKPRIEMVPHLTIETNMTCNFRCRNCYNHNQNQVKTLEEIKGEIDLGLELRKADTITLIGGEPSLHPDLLEIVRYIRLKGVVAQMLTNGFIFLSDSGDAQLKQLQQCGLNRILLHIDEGQDAYPDPVASIHEFLGKTNQIKLLTTVSWTIYRGQQGRIPDLIAEFSAYPYFDGFLCTLEKAVDQAIQPGFVKEDWPQMEIEYASLRKSLNLQPSLYLPSSLEDGSITWLVYLYYFNSKTHQSFYISPRLTRIYQKLYLRYKKREIFGIAPVHQFFGLTLTFIGLIESMLSPKRFGGFLLLLKDSGWMSLIRYQYLAIQDGPHFDSESGRVAICYHCPDATVRNGRITPVCLADRISPMPGEEAPANTPPDLLTLVYEHLHQ